MLLFYRLVFLYYTMHSTVSEGDPHGVGFEDRAVILWIQSRLSLQSVIVVPIDSNGEPSIRWND